MLRLLTIEFHKLKHNRASRVLTLLYFLLIIPVLSIIRMLFQKLNVDIEDLGVFNFPYIWHFSSYFTAFLKIFLAIVIVSMMANEYSNRTLKQNLIDGMSKKEFILSKFYTVIAFAVISTLFLFLVTLILGLIYSDYTELSIVFSDLSYLVGYFVKLLGFFAFCLFLGILVKRSAFALGFLFVWWIAESILGWVIGFATGNLEVAQKISAIFPLESMGNLVVEPVTRLNMVKSATAQFTDAMPKDYDIHGYQLLIVLIWTSIFMYGSYILLKKRDL